ncbi:malignant T-cell-amplified sequence 1 homolog [Selaginella moellendorffii]|uniref:malignant T-cell-amplified sequence 1 homolog n=1 Tax=Selaginella moellendorffii TaxID=88036 RepID=UPI000D1C66DF|nr:malignant T-cell-amplified sequence 1 homolog [Selaginella moellendorffii]|eukprot:XP_024540282.1 malignant T-cell-amplified sequence 1 homolog [Selaginella moellendorffii]
MAELKLSRQKTLYISLDLELITAHWGFIYPRVRYKAPFLPRSIHRSARSEELRSGRCCCARDRGSNFEMFKKFSQEEVTAQNQVKASVQRKIRQSVAEEYPELEPVLDDILPKKSPVIVAKCQNHVNLILVNNVPLFFNVRDGPYMPTLRLLHQYPTVMKKLQVDRGAIKFVLAGANIMCPGLTSPGGGLDESVAAEAPVAIMAEGKQHALAIGFTKMSALDIKNINKGIGVDNMHYLNDGLWKTQQLN